MPTKSSKQWNSFSHKQKRALIGAVKRKSHIQTLFDNINGGDCVDSAAEAQEIAEALLKACKRAIGAMVVELPLDAIVRAQAILTKAIDKAEGKPCS